MSHSDSIQYQGLLYRRDVNAFLTVNEARYGLERLWELCDGRPNWTGEPLLVIPAATHAEVDETFRAATLPCPVAKLADLLPQGTKHRFSFADLPLLFAGQRAAITPDSAAEFPIDLVTFAFVMLTRWEEFHGQTGLDMHGRARRQDMLAYRHGFDDRPIVDQWAQILRAWIAARTPAALAAPRAPSVFMTHDVDRPLKFTSLSRVLRGGAGELIARSHNPMKAAGEVLRGLHALRSPQRDPFAMELQRLMAWNEQQGLRGGFYLMTSTGGPWDDGYDASQGSYRRIVDEMVQRGHEIGWHPGYQSAVDPDVFTAEKQRIDAISAGTALGGRQHYLRWTVGQSWERWDDAGLRYDSSVGFADAVGFRCGTARPFPVYSLARQRPLSLIERPLALMDCALEIACQDGNEPLELVETLLQRVDEVGGESVLLIHNSFTDLKILDAIMRGVERRDHRHRGDQPAPVEQARAA